VTLQKYEATGEDCYKEAATSLQKGCQDVTIREEEKINCM
jgi:hypothetical protein